MTEVARDATLSLTDADLEAGRLAGLRSAPGVYPFFPSSGDGPHKGLVEVRRRVMESGRCLFEV